MTDPNSYYGEVWHTHVIHDASYFGVLFYSGNRMVGMDQLGMALEAGVEYVTFTYYTGSGLSPVSVVDASSEVVLPLQQDQLEFDIMYFSPLWETSSSTTVRVAFLGDRSKYVPFSRGRFPLVSSDGEILTVVSVGYVPELDFAFVSQEGDVERLTARCVSILTHFKSGLLAFTKKFR